MEIDWSRVRRVILNDRLLGYKPDRECIDLLVAKLPDVKILGFGYYGFYNRWYLFVESKHFAPIEDEVISNIPITNIPKFGKRPVLPGTHRYPTPTDPDNAS